MMMEGEMVVGCVIEETLLLVLGIGNASGDQVTAFLNGDPALSVKVNLVTWPLKEPSPAGTHGFVAIVPTGVLRRGILKTVMFQHKAKVARYNFASRAAPVADFVAMIGDLAGPSLRTVIDELVEGLISGPIGRKKLAAITVLLQVGARDFSSAVKTLRWQNVQSAFLRALISTIRRRVLPVCCLPMSRLNRTILNACYFADDVAGASRKSMIAGCWPDRAKRQGIFVPSCPACAVQRIFCCGCARRPIASTAARPSLACPSR